MDDSDFRLESGEKLEEWLDKQNSDHFPRYQEDTGHVPYPEKYKRYKEELKPVHDAVEKGAMATEVLKDGNLSANDERLIYLNNHGRGHVEKVIQKATEILYHFDSGHLTPY